MVAVRICGVLYALCASGCPAPAESIDDAAALTDAGPFDAAVADALGQDMSHEDAGPPDASQGDAQPADGSSFFDGGPCLNVIVDFPFGEYAIAADHLEIRAASGIMVKAEIGPWGAHGVAPHSGHTEGDGKSNSIAYPLFDRKDMTELADHDNDGICEEDQGEICGVHKSVLDDSIFQYVAPSDQLIIHTVELTQVDDPGNPVNYPSGQDWDVRGTWCQYSVVFGHIASISGDLRDAMIAKGYPDPWSLLTPQRIDMLANPVVLNQGDAVAQPQMVAAPIDGHPDYYRGKFNDTGLPWIDLEFNIGNRTAMYLLMAADKQALLEDMLWAQAQNPDSPRYGFANTSPIYADARWAWAAEMVLVATAERVTSTFTTIYEDLGGWWEQPGGPCQNHNVLCDECFSIFQIHKTTIATGATAPFYDSDLYESPDVSWLVGRMKAGVQSFGQVVTPEQPSAAGDTLLVKWVHNFAPYPPQGPTKWQKLTYALFPSDSRMKIRRGTEYDTRDAAEAEAVPAPTSVDTCDGETIACYNHQFNRY